MTTVLVVGGFGFYGSMAVEALERFGFDVSAGTRTPRGRPRAVAIDLDTPATWEGLSGFDFIVNCSDTVNCPPDGAIRYVLEAGGVWLELGADAPTIDRLLAIEVPEVKGSVVLGVGVFPGLSTALARAVAESGPPPSRLDLGIRLSPLSGAGPGNCALMAKSLFVPATRIEGGERRESTTAVGPTRPLPYGGTDHTSVTYALPDTELVWRATRVPDLSAHLSLIPGFLRFNFTLLAWVCALLRPARPVLLWLLTWQLRLVRALLLRGVKSPLVLVAVADRGSANERSRELRFEDGQTATAEGAAAAVRALAGRDVPHGVRGLAEIVSLDELGY